MNMINIAVIGVGKIGKMHVENIINNIKGLKVVAVMDKFIKSNTSWAKNLKIKIITDNEDDIFLNESIHAVLISSMTDTHIYYIRKCIKHKKHIFCEKPIDLNINSVIDVVKEVRNSKLKFQMGFNRRFDINFSSLKKAINSFKIGELRTLKLFSKDPKTPSLEYCKNSGGMFIDMSIHDFDLIRFLAGSEVQEVSAYASIMIDKEGCLSGCEYDVALIIARMENGVLAMIENCRENAFGYDQRAEAYGSTGSIIMDNANNNTLSYGFNDGIKRDNPPFFFIDRYQNAYVKQLNSFYNAILNDTDTDVGVEDGFYSIKIALAVSKSVKERRSVRLDELDFNI